MWFIILCTFIIWGRKIKSSDIFSMTKTRTNHKPLYMKRISRWWRVHQPIHNNNKTNVHIKCQCVYVWFRCVCSLMTSFTDTKMDIVSQTLLFTVVIRSIFRNTTQHSNVLHSLAPLQASIQVGPKVGWLKEWAYFVVKYDFSCVCEPKFDGMEYIEFGNVLNRIYKYVRLRCRTTAFTIRVNELRCK